MLSILDREKESFYEFINSQQVSKKAQQIKLLKLHFDCYTNILGYNMSRNSAYRVENNIPRDQREIDLEKEIPDDPEFYDFLDPELINQETALLAGGDYYFLLNRIEFADVIRKDFDKPNTGLLLPEILSQVDFPNELSKDEIELMEKVIACKKDTACIKAITANDSWTEFSKKYQSEISFSFNKIMTSKYEKKKKEALDKYFAIADGIIPDIFIISDKCRQMESTFQPIEDEALNEATSKIMHPFIKEYLTSLNEVKKAEIAAKLEAIESKDGYVKNETPIAEADEIFDEIMKKYRGKLVYVDFWATWCGPCRSGMKRIKPLKEEMKGKDIAFVYITNHTSPENTYNLMIPDIAGEHYRVSEDQWNYLSGKFNITGIPHYVLVDQQGMVIQDKISLGMQNDALKRLFEKHLQNN
jgi:thiol-disulfide isomerase/thioredoxin